LSFCGAALCIFFKKMIISSRRRRLVSYDS
jgi:hypothetical protein